MNQPNTNAVRVTRLDNGLVVVSEAMPGFETVSFGAYVSAGTRNERPEENGVSHFLEHMAFKGTERRDAAAIAREIENVGGHLNAYTAREQTAYYCKVMKEDFSLAVDLIGDILTHSTFVPEELERERGVILQEIGQANDTPDDIIFDHFQQTAFPDQAMGRPTLGTEDIIRSMSRETLLQYMAANYSPERMVVAAAGAVDHQRLVDLVARNFADLPRPSEDRVEAARYQGGEFREQRDLDQVHIVLGFPGPSYSDARHYPTMLLSTLLGGGMSSRLFQEIREKRGLVYSIYAFNSPFRDSGLLAIYAGTGEEEVKELMPVTLQELRKVQTEITEEELDRAKAQLRSSLLMSLESTGSRIEQLARQIQIYGRVVSVDEIKARIAGVTREQVQEAAVAAFTAAPTIVSLGQIEKFPSLGDLKTALSG